MVHMDPLNRLLEKSRFITLNFINVEIFGLKMESLENS